MTNPLTAVQGYRTLIVSLVALVAGALQVVGLGMGQSTQGGLVLIILALLAAYFRLRAKHIFVGGFSIQKVAVAMDTLFPEAVPPVTGGVVPSAVITATTSPLTGTTVFPFTSVAPVAPVAPVAAPTPGDPL